MSEPIAYRVNDVPAVAGISRSTLYRLIAAGELHPLKVGSRTLIERSDLEAYFSRLRTAQAA